jgi:hypothetical protein
MAPSHFLAADNGQFTVTVKDVVEVAPLYPVVTVNV